MENKLTMEILGKLKPAKSVKEYIELAKAHGVELEEKMAIKLFEEKDKLEELADEALADVAGGIYRGELFFDPRRPL